MRTIILIMSVCVLISSVTASVQSTNELDLPDPFNEIERDIADIRNRPEDVENPWAMTMSEDEYLFFRKRLGKQDPNAALALVGHYKNLCQKSRYQIRAARWGYVNMHSGLAGRESWLGEEECVDTEAVEYWQCRGAILGSEYCAEQLEKKGIMDRVQQFGFMRIRVEPKGHIEICEAAGEYEDFVVGTTWPGEYNIFLTPGTDTEDKLKRIIVRVKSDELVDVVFDVRTGSEPTVSYVPLAAANLPMVVDIGFLHERSFMVGPGLDIVFRRVEPGIFMMGEFLGEHLDRKWILGRRETRIDEPYWMSRYEVTQGVFNSVMGRDTCPSQDLHYPVETTWEEARTFCRLLTKKEKEAGRIPENMIFDLPTEAQWEYALLAGRCDYDRLRQLADKQQVLSLRDESLSDELKRQGWLNWNDRGKSYQVGQKEPNAWGFYDMIGGKFEMCLDIWNEEDVNKGEGHVIRGSGIVFTECKYLPFGHVSGFRVCLQESTDTNDCPEKSNPEQAE